MKVAASAATAVVCAAVLTLICGAKPFSHWEDELEGKSEDSVVTAAPVGEVEMALLRKFFFYILLWPVDHIQYIVSPVALPWHCHGISMVMPPGSLPLTILFLQWHACSYGCAHHTFATCMYWC